MSDVILFLKKYKIEIYIIVVLLLVPFLEPIFEVIVECLFNVGRYIGTWIRGISEGYLC